MEDKRILLVDNDEPFRELMQYVLESEGYTFCGVSEPSDIAVLAHEVQPSLILLDYCKPASGCCEDCTLLHNSPDLQTIPVILLSAYPETQLPLSRLPYTAFIPKPFDLWKLMSHIHVLLHPQTACTA